MECAQICDIDGLVLWLLLPVCMYLSDLCAVRQITINRPERRNAFRPLTVMELKRAFDFARDDPEVGVIIFTGKVLTKDSHASILCTVSVFCFQVPPSV